MDIKRPPAKQPIPPHAQKVFSGEFFSIYQWNQTLFDGSTALFEKVVRPDSVGVIALTNKKTVVLAKQEQPGIEPFTGLLGGVIDPSENPLEAAKRELLEEGGMVSDSWKLWYSDQPFTRLEWGMYVFIARDVEVVADQQLEPGEKISTYEVPLENFIDEVLKDTFRDTELKAQLFTKDGIIDKAILENLFFGD